jgi:hypothetical protein
MAGSIALSLTQRYDKTSHEPLDGGALYFYAAGTTTPQSAYQDISLTIPWPNPITLDSGGNVPQLFFADGYIKFRLSNATGVTQIEADFVLVLGPTAGAGAAPSVDATTILATGDIKVRYGTGVLTGFVRSNGRTIGSASSGASERANSDCQTLFEYLWTEDANLTVSTGRGASAAADWAANKNIALPDWRGRAIAGLDDMGNSAAGRLTSTYFGTAATVLGAAGGLESNNVILTHLHTASAVADHQHFTVVAGTGSVTLTASNAPGRAFNDGSNNSYSLAAINQGADIGLTSLAGGHTPSIQNAGSASAHNVVHPTMLATIYLKL